MNALPDPHLTSTIQPGLKPHLLALLGEVLWRREAAAALGPTWDEERQEWESLATELAASLSEDPAR